MRLPRQRLSDTRSCLDSAEARPFYPGQPRAQSSRETVAGDRQVVAGPMGRSGRRGDVQRRHRTTSDGGIGPPSAGARVFRTREQPSRGLLPQTGLSLTSRPRRDCDADRDHLRLRAGTSVGHVETRTRSRGDLLDPQKWSDRPPPNVRSFRVVVSSSSSINECSPCRPTGNPLNRDR